MTDVEALVREWLAWDRDDDTRRVIAALWRRGEVAQLRQLLATRLSFGTAGLRARMGAGNARMNNLTVLQAAQGLCAYLQHCHAAATLARGGVVIGYDGRRHSDVFARRTAAVLHAAGVRTLLYRRVVATPLVPFAIRHAGLQAGVMVTASHNPKDDNGYKVFWCNGAQLAPPHEAALLACMRAHLPPRDTSWALYDGDGDADATLTDAYFAALAADYRPMYVPCDKSSSSNSNCSINSSSSSSSHHTSLRFTYTAMHGVGTRFAERALAHVGVVAPHTLVHVRAQAQPDASFPTVPVPNPEEGARVLQLAFAAAEAAHSHHILANDPDADRLAVAERQPRVHGDDNNSSNCSRRTRTTASAAWHVFSGNELAALLGWWALTCARRDRHVHPHDPLQRRRTRAHADKSNNVQRDNNDDDDEDEAAGVLRDCVFLSSTVSSPILATMAAAEGMQHVETLTGFKWMGSAAARMLHEDDVSAAASQEQQCVEDATNGTRDGNNSSHCSGCDTPAPRHRRRTILFAFEESIGFMWGTRVLDKDGISAAAVVADMTNYCAHVERTRAALQHHSDKDKEGDDDKGTRARCVEDSSAGVLWRQLQRVYAAYGYHYTHTSYVLCDDARKLQQLWHRLRSCATDTGYPAVVAGEAVVAVRDLGTGVDTRKDNKTNKSDNSSSSSSSSSKGAAALPLSPSSPLLTLYFADARFFALRSSGTEPKLKWYAALVSRDAGGAAAFVRWATQAAEELVQPDRHGFVRRGSTRSHAATAKL